MVRPPQVAVLYWDCKVRNLETNITNCRRKALTLQYFNKLFSLNIFATSQQTARRTRNTEGCRPLQIKGEGAMLIYI